MEISIKSFALIANPRRSGGMRPALPWVVVLLVVVFGGVAVYSAGPYRTGNLIWGSPVHRSDYSVYWEAGRAVLHGTDIYSVRNVRGWAYVYPPPFAIAMVPLSVLPLFLSIFLWYAISAGLAIGAAVMCARLVTSKQDDARQKLRNATIPMLLLLVWFGHGLARGQASVLVAWLVIAAVYWEHKGRTLAGAASLAGAVLLKVFPLSLLAYYAWRGKWRFVAATLCALILGTLILPAFFLGWRGNLHDLAEWRRTVADPALASEPVRAHSALYDQLLSMEKPRNQALAPVLYRLFGGEGNFVFSAGLAVALAFPIWLLGRRRARSEPLILAAAIVWMLMISPVAEDHYFSVFLLPVAIAVSAWGAASGAVRKVIAGCLAAFGLLNFSAVFGHRFEFYGVVCWGGLVLLGLLLYLSWLEGRPGPRSDALPLQIGARTYASGT